MVSNLVVAPVLDLTVELSNRKWETGKARNRKWDKNRNGKWEQGFVQKAAWAEMRQLLVEIVFINISRDDLGKLDKLRSTAMDFKFHLLTTLTRDSPKLNCLGKGN